MIPSLIPSLPSLCLRLFPVLMQHLFIAGPGERREATVASLSVARPFSGSLPAASWRKYIFRRSACDTPTARRSWSAKEEEAVAKKKEGLGWNYGASPACEVVSNEE